MRYPLFSLCSEEVVIPPLRSRCIICMDGDITFNS